MTNRGKVLKSTGKWYIVELDDQSIVNCRIRGKLRLDELRTTNPIAVGDIVTLAQGADDDADAHLAGLSVDRTGNSRLTRNFYGIKQGLMQIVGLHIMQFLQALSRY